MFSFLGDFIRSAGRDLDVILLDEDALDAPRRYRVRPAQILALVGAVSLGVGLILVLLLVLTPAKGLFPGLATDEMRRTSRLNALRLEAMEDSVAAQTQYVDHIRNLMMGRIPEGPQTETSRPNSADTGGLSSVPANPGSADWEEHAQPAFSISRMPIGDGRALPAVVGPIVLAPRFPVLPPVDGFLTRGFEPRIGHYALDMAVAEGTVVRAMSDGYVVLADWTHDGGYVIAIQHSGGYLSVYKHNQRLMKRVGDRVTAREPIAASGNTGEVTTGPHLHFELWHDGHAQDPTDFLLMQ
jgi:peptidase M23-like protein